MGKQIDYGWRLFATGLSFAVFGIGGFLLWVLVFPLLNSLPVHRERKIRRAQKCVQLSFYFFIGFMHRIGVMTYQITGLEKLNRPGQLIVANHPTLVDIVFLISRIPAANCIVKEKLWHNPFTKGPIINAGYISNGDPEKMINDCVDCLRRGGTMIIFPEGTRSVPGKAYKFQRGAAAIALKANAIVTPVTLSCVPSTLTKAEKWYQIPERRFHLAMRVGDDMVLDDFQAMEPKTLAVRRFNRYLQDYFSQQRERYEQFGE
ncbi:lysophospholipid acyltransferase family protein [Methylomarinum sp. Ch1-1]|uniref:Lysophospholipid acyltransferase family protein n=1 Tax=Methylomarinum roseum TaxID=3067653 RepID=A0AAU7NX70_9GAMM|nr:lysophospholipid acyltransferase family protein [Methylomarinum sp. Ch1-1]MDP4522386.1 lysophospholipid acyltransferase family protein [Methylomarinum sp. Ch1-1]